MSVDFSSHAKQRLQQRGLREADVALILSCGTDLGNGRIVLRRSDADQEIVRRKREIERLQHLRDTIVVTLGSQIVTEFRVDTAERSRRLRQTLRECSV